MEIKHIAIEENGTVTVQWNMSMDEYKELVKDAEAELKLEGEQRKITTKVPFKECHDEQCDCPDTVYPCDGEVTGERGFQTRDRDRSGRDAIEDDLYVKGDK